MFIKKTKEGWKDNTKEVGTCWIWQGSLREGYGQVFISRKYHPQGAHVFAFELFHRPLYVGEIVLHSCNNRACVNPEHLRAGTYSDNQQDFLKSGRLAEREEKRIAAYRETCARRRSGLEP